MRVIGMDIHRVFAEAVIDAVLGAGEFEGMGAEDFAALQGLTDERCR